MGRSVLLSVMLMTTLFAAILVSLNRNMIQFPRVMVRNALNKEAENVSDFALRNAIRNAGSQEFLQSYLEGEHFEDELKFTQVFHNFKIGNCTIDSLRYSFVNSQGNYKVKSFIRASMQGVNVSRDAEMAFDYPLLTLGGSKPNIIYLEMERLLLFPWLFHDRELPDSSGNGYSGTAGGFSLISATIPWGGAYSKYCTKFNGIDNYISVDPQVDPATGVDSLSTDNSFSLLIFAKLDKNGYRALFTNYDKNQGTLLWIPSEPESATMKLKPCAGIWYDKADGKMHFAVTQNDVGRTMLEVKVAHTRTAVIWNFILGIPFFNLSFAEYPWCSYGITYNSGTLKGYINGVNVGTVSGTNIRAYPSLYGMSIGRRDIRVAGVKYDDYRYFCGVMDQSGMHDRALTAGEMKSWHNGVMSATLIKYIRD
ncbi:MAG: LamG domain-containing protein [Candidatus Cloacimonetes bacterium]|nr:LamG domain-containing protein [Candidatus Cloacimonadota bacterium]